MKLETVGHGAENAVLQIMQLFFDIHSDAEATSRLFEEDGQLVSEAVVSFGGRRAIGRASTRRREKLYVTNCVKKAVFYAAGQISSMPAPWGISTGIRPAKAARRMMEEGLEDDEIISSFENEYLTERSKARLALEVAKNEQRLLSEIGESEIGVYVGIPFCPSRCAYCSFISRATEHNGKFVEPYVDALIKEIEYSGQIVREAGQRVGEVYFGGGTPTAIAVPLLRRIIEAVRLNFDFSYVREFTVEAGRPDTFSEEMLAMLKDEGVTRISINPQTMNPATLEAVGRKHSVDDVKRAFCIARGAGIASINADLIAGLPGETEEDMAYSVEELLKLGPDAVTVHTLYMKRAADMIGDFARLRFAKNAGAMVDTAQRRLRENAMEPYYMYKQRNTLGNLENVGYAKRGHESVYNVCIMEEVQTILALGAGGSTKIVRADDIERIFNPKDAADYIKRFDEVLRRKDEYRAKFTY